MFELASLESALAETVFDGKLHFSPVTDSTNNDALAAARNGAPHGSVYFADEQLAGRGRGHHSWHSAAGEGLYVSVLLRPQIPAARLPMLPLCAGLAAADAVGAVSGLEVDLRWPNDLLISTPQTKTGLGEPRFGPRKTGGILVESQSEGSTVAFVVVGIGINVHQRSFAPELSTAGTSLDLVAGCTIHRQPLLISLLKSLERETQALADADAEKTIPVRVEKASTWVRGKSVEVHGPQACTGVTAGLDRHGFLLVRTAAGVVTVQTGGIRASDTN